MDVFLAHFDSNQGGTLYIDLVIDMIQQDCIAR